MEEVVDSIPTMSSDKCRTYGECFTSPLAFVYQIASHLVAVQSEPARAGRLHDAAGTCLPRQCLDLHSAGSKAFAGPKNSYGTQVYPGFLYDTGITLKHPIPGLLNPSENGLFGP